ncbi:AAA family ATPase [Chengkuizengella sediminis]|uniref:AAA family ATPase n=1 Tax=Chengkuizengella sediminis TaxID=1885917 RepID=UPI0013898B98|nr:AAA family ATPase [Chengkuizengella sediminis]NDI34863.1 AAA family ATPase [Chengkuizengella sediminis]
MESYLKNFENDNIMVEFLGVPGTGKTTISHMVSKSLSKNGVHVHEPTYAMNSMGKTRRQYTKILSIIKVFLIAPRTCIYAIKLIIPSQQKSLKDFIKTVINLLFIIFIIKSCSNKKGVHILDQGFFQAIWSIEYSANHHIEGIKINKLRKMVYSKPLLVIDIHAVHTEVLQRLNLRETNYSRVEKEFLNSLTEQHIQLSYEIINRLKDEIQEGWNKEKDLELISLNNDTEELLYANTDIITEYILSLLNKSTLSNTNKIH